MKLVYLCSVIIFFQFVSFRAGAESAQTEFIRSFQSERILFPSDSSDFAQKIPGEDPVWMHWFFQDLLAWNPSGKPAYYTNQCQPKVWAEKLSRKKVKAQGLILSEYLKKCASELETGVNRSWIHTLKIMSVQQDFKHHPLMHRVVFQLPNGDKVKGRLALKGDLKKRPLVIFRLGVFANSEEFKPETFIMMMLFEQGPFNVLVLENDFNPQYAHFNSQKTIGGFTEGLQNMWIAKTLTDSREPMSQIIGTIHLAGMSLGGHGVFFASLLNEFNKNQRSQKIFSSFLGFCPVVDLKKNFDRLTDSGFRGMGIEFWSRFRLQELRSMYSDLNTWDFENWLLLRPTFLKKLGLQIEKDFKPDISKRLGLTLPAGLIRKNTFWSLQDFWPSYRNVGAPVMIWATTEDPLVPLIDNAKTLQKDNISLVEFERGYHCTLPIGYDWSAISTLMSAYFLSHDLSLEMKLESTRVELSEDYKSKAEDWFINKVEWLANDPQVINLKLQSRVSPGQSADVLVSLDKLDFRLRNSQISQTEKFMIERWVFQNVQLVNKPRDTALWLQWKRVL